MKWQLGFSDSAYSNPADWVEVETPIDVQLAYCSDLHQDIFLGKKSDEFRWTEDKWWHFTTELSVPRQEGRVPFLEFKGIDYAYTIFFNDEKILEDEGMFTPLSFDLSAYQGGVLNVKVLIHPIPKKAGMPDGNTQPAASCIPAVSYGWDWHPRLVPVGIYDEVSLVYKPFTRVSDAELSYELSEDLKRVTGQMRFAVTQPKGSARFQVWDDRENMVFAHSFALESENVVEFTVESPNLWWCRDQGEQRFYYFELIAEDQQDEVLYRKRCGFRRSRLLMNEGAWEGEHFPKTQGKAPITLELNGRRIFAKGTNFVPAELFPSLMTREVYLPLLELARDCNMNILRLWGGGLVNKECFFDLCDEMGLMVWQEFPLACNNYENDAHYLKILDKESRSIIRRLKTHPSVVLWCGGNELFCSWGGMTNQSHALRLLDKNCFELDRNTPFIHTAPLYGMGHGNYLLLNGYGGECLTDVVNSNFTAYSEFGVPSPSPYHYLKTIIPEQELQEVSENGSWEHHHALRAWGVQTETWFCVKQIQEYTGPLNSLEELVEKGLLIQAEVYKNIYEEVRRKWPYSSMALNWCFNEPWPTAANNSIVNYPAEPKPGYYAVQSALRNQMFSVKMEKMIYRPGDTLRLEVFLLNDLPSPLLQSAYSLLVKGSDGTVYGEWGTRESPAVKACSVEKLEVFELQLTEQTTSEFSVVLKAADESLSSEYTLFFRK